MLVAAGLLLLTLIYFGGPIIKGDVVMMRRDGMIYYFLIKMLVGQMLADGVAPLWNPYLFGGMPLLAAIEPGVLYPPNWLSALLPPTAAMTVTTLIGYHLALCGSYLFGRRIGLTRTGAAVTGICFAFGGFMMAQMDLTHYVMALVWLPWMLLALEAIYQHCLPGGSLKAAWRWVTAGAVFLALQNFAGAPQAVFQTMLVCLCYALFCLTVRDRRVSRGRLLLTGALLAVCGALLSAIQLLPTIELRMRGERAQIGYEFFASWSMPWRQLLTLIFPFFFGPQWQSFYQSPPKDEAWQLTLSHGYIGLAGLLLALAAVIGSLFRPVSNQPAETAAENPAPGWRRLVWFWLAVAIIGLLCAAGDNLPFRLHRLLYRLPVYNFFRCPYRHLFEYTFAAAVLAGLGATYLTTAPRAAVKRTMIVGSGLLTALTALAATAYQFSPRLFPSAAGAAVRLSDREVIVPVISLLLGLAAVWFYVQRPARLSALLVIGVLMCDLMLMGKGFEWHAPAREVQDFYSLTPAVSFIKAREADLNSFRIHSYSLVRYPFGYREMIYQNLPVAHQLQAVSGYDPLRPDREAEVAGELDFEGTVRDASLVGLQHQGDNLLNVRYLLRQERLTDSTPSQPGAGFVSYGGIPFRPGSLNLQLDHDKRESLEAGNFAATELALVSTMSHATHLTDGATVARVIIHRRDGQLVERTLQAGRDTAEWAYDRPEVRAAIKHQRPAIAFSLDSGEGFPAHRYLARLQFDRAEIDYIEFQSAAPGAEIGILAASLRDGTSGSTRALDLTRLPPERWKLLKRFDTLAIYENLKALPRAWFVSEIRTLSRSEVIESIKSGRLPDGAPFDPARTALLEREDLPGREISSSIADPQAQARIIGYAPNRIELAVSSSQPAFLVVSEMFYPGWQAWLDGRQIPIERADYILRGLAIPAGAHRLELVFRSTALRQGFIGAIIGALILFIGAITISRNTTHSTSPQRPQRFTE